MTTQIQKKRGTAARWASLNLTLAAGEAGLETDTKRQKTGDGTTKWNDLPYDFDQTLADARYPQKADVIPPGQKGAAGGVATLDGNTRIPAAQMPLVVVQRWQANTAYAAGDPVLSPNGDTVFALAAFTSGSSWDATKWSLKSVDAGGVMAWQGSQASVTGITGTWMVVAIQQLAAKAGRTYRLAARVNTLCIGAANIAYAMEVRKSAPNDSSNAGPAVDDSGTFYTAPVAGQGSIGLGEWFYRPTVDETVNLKLVSTRAAGSSPFDIQQPRLNVFDVGAQV